MKGITVELIVKTVQGRDSYGNDQTISQSYQVDGCAFVPEQTSESVQGAEEVIANGKLYVQQQNLPFPGALQFLDAAIINGKIYQVQGETANWESPFTNTKAPLMVNLREVTGGSAHTVSEGGG